MTNYEKWLAYTDGLSSPQNYIEWTWRYIVCASLQRRVWLPPDHNPCFPNPYMFLTGKPGIGKGLCIREAKYFLSYWKKKDAIIASNGHTPEQLSAAELVREADLKHAREVEQQQDKKAELIEPLLIPMAADATTYEALVAAVAKSYSRVDYMLQNGDKKEMKIYGHSSICFCLPELGSLFRKQVNDTINYLLGVYDSPEDYIYDTKTKGKDRVRRACLCLLAAATPSFMESVFDDKLIDEGFSSRTFFIYATKNRKNQMLIPPLDENQIQCRMELLAHIRNLTSLYGQVNLNKETWNFLQTWWDEHESNPSVRRNKSPKLEAYYSRKNLHVMKVAMALHFSESTEMDIPLERFKEAIEVLNQEEANMHLALVMESRNPIAKIADAILLYLKTGPKNFVDIYTEIISIGNKEEIEEALDFLTLASQIKQTSVEDETTKEMIPHWERIK